HCGSAEGVRDHLKSIRLVRPAAQRGHGLVYFGLLRGGGRASLKLVQWYSALAEPQAKSGNVVDL
ncbi:MAG: hypothetical protein ABJP33_16155, partial [Pseudoruegeria sp.]